MVLIIAKTCPKSNISFFRQVLLFGGSMGAKTELTVVRQRNGFIGTSPIFGCRHCLLSVGYEKNVRYLVSQTKKHHANSHSALGAATRGWWRRGRQNRIHCRATKKRFYRNFPDIWLPGLPGCLSTIKKIFSADLCRSLNSRCFIVPDIYTEAEI